MLALAVLPFLVQGALMLVDEGVHHRRRGLPRWERIGHPLDTLTTAACYAWLVVATPTRGHAVAYAALAVVSCLFVTKDEVVHTSVCSAGEHWNHALLFVLHPVVLGVAGWVWWTRLPIVILVLQLALTAAFAAYQALYWNGPWQRAR